MGSLENLDQLFLVGESLARHPDAQGYRDELMAIEGEINTTIDRLIVENGMEPTEAEIYRRLCLQRCLGKLAS